MVFGRATGSAVLCRCRAFRYKSSLRSGLFTSIAHANSGPKQLLIIEPNFQNGQNRKSGF